MIGAAAQLRTLRGRLFASVREVAEILEADERTVRHAIEAGEIPAVRLGPNSVRIRVVPFLQQVAGLSAIELQQLGFLDDQEQNDGGPITEPPSTILTLAKEKDHDHGDPQPPVNATTVRLFRER